MIFLGKSINISSFTLSKLDKSNIACDIFPKICVTEPSCILLENCTTMSVTLSIDIEWMWILMTEDNEHS